MQCAAEDDWPEQAARKLLPDQAGEARPALLQCHSQRQQEEPQQHPQQGSKPPGRTCHQAGMQLLVEQRWVLLSTSAAEGRT